MARGGALVLLVGGGGGGLSAPRADALAEAWARSGLGERVARLGPVYAWSDAPGAWPRAETAARLAQALEREGADAIVLVEPAQLFLDVELARNAIERLVADPRLDTFTQQEHCRLPVGVGVRVLSARAWRELDVASPVEAWERLREEPAGRRFGYETARRVSYADSLLDARASDAVLARLAKDAPTTWDLAGFLEWVARGGDELRAALRFAPDARAARVDERGMAAAYGFESLACAEFPTYVMFDVTNVCNARCVHCPQSLRDEDGGLPLFLRDQEHQTLDAFRRVIDECAGHRVSFVRITADGEPLMHPDLFEMLEYARDRDVGTVGLTTNASLLTEARAKRLLEAGIGMVDFSLDAARAETFGEIRVGLSFEKTRRNVLRFLELRERTRAPVRVVVSFVKQAKNVAEADEFVAYWQPRVDEVVVREMISNVGLNEPSATARAGEAERWPCAHFFRRVVVNHRGELKACPIDWEQRTVNRPVEQVGVFDQWHGDFYWRHRMQHLNDAIETSSACHGCGDWAGTPWDLGYEKIVERLVPAEASS